MRLENYGQLEKIAGDAIMAYWQGNDAKRWWSISLSGVLHCSKIENLRWLAATKSGLLKNHPLNAHMALATGCSFWEPEA